MRIAVFHELPYGGARRAVNELSRELKKKHIVDLYVVDEESDTSESSFFTSRHFYKFVPKKWKGKNWKVRLYKDTIELLKLYRVHRNIASDIFKKKYDIVFIHSSKYTEAPFLLRFKNTKKVFYCHDPHYRMLYEPLLDIPQNIDIFRKYYEILNRKMRKIIDRTNIQQADMVLANSKYTQNGVRKAYGISSTVCYLGVNHHLFTPMKHKKDLDLFYIGSREPVDGYPLLQDVLKLLKQDTTKKILTVEDEWIDDDKVLRDYYSRSKLVLCFAVNEPLGLVPLEAMACGTPVIATDEAGHRETVLDRNTGLLVKRDAQKIASDIKRLLKTPYELERMGKNARDTIIKYWSWEKAAERIEKVFSEALTK